MEDHSAGPPQPVPPLQSAVLPPAPRWPAVLFALAVAWSLVSPWCTRDAAVDAATLDAVAGELRQLPPRTFVLVHPTWRADVTAGLASRLSGVDVGPALPPDAMEGRRPVVVVRVPHAPGPAAVWRLPQDERREVSGVELLFLAGANRASPPSPAAPVAPAAQSSGAWNVLEALRTARVEVRGDRQVQCNAWDQAGGRWMCPGMDEWNFVGPRTLPVEGRPLTCVWAHPVTGATLSITFPGVPLGRALLVGHALADGAATNPEGQPVALTVTSGGARLQVEHPNQPGVRQDRLETATGTTADVTLEVRTPHDGARHFCFTLAVEP